MIAVSGALATPARAQPELVYGRWTGTWFVDEQRNEWGQLVGHPPYPPVAFSLTLFPFDPIRERYGFVGFVEELYPWGDVRTLSVQDGLVSLTIDYSAYCSIPPDPRYYALITGSADGNVMTGDYDEPVPAAPGWISFLGPFELTRIPEQQPPLIATPPQPLDFNDTAVQRVLEVWNVGGGTLEYQFQSWPMWVTSITPPSETSAGPNDKKTHTVTIDRCRLAAGQNTGTIQIVSAYASNSPQLKSCSATGTAGTLVLGTVAFRDRAGNDLPQSTIPATRTLAVSLWDTPGDFEGPDMPAIFRNRDVKLQGPYPATPPDGHLYYYYSLRICELIGGRSYTIAHSVTGSDSKVTIVEVGDPAVVNTDVVLTCEGVQAGWGNVPGRYCRKSGLIKYQFGPWPGANAAAEKGAVVRGMTSWAATGVADFQETTDFDPDIWIAKWELSDAQANSYPDLVSGKWVVRFDRDVTWDVTTEMNWSEINTGSGAFWGWQSVGSPLLEAAALHETGHVLGLRYSEFPWTSEGPYGDCRRQQWSIMDYLSCRDGRTTWLGWSDVVSACELGSPSLSARSYCPVDLVLTDNAGNVVSKTLNQIPGAVYIEQDLDGNGELDDEIIVPEPVTGQYSIAMVPQPGTIQEGDVTVVVEDHGTNYVLLDAVPIAELPTEPMTLTVDRTPPTLTVQAGPASLDPCDDRMVPIHVNLQVQDETDPNPQAALAGIAGGWPADPNDIVDAEIGTADTDFELRATCDGICGQHYTIVYAAVDATGNQTIVSTTAALADDTSGSFADCNTNGVPDECEVKRGTSPDCNSDGIPDECQLDSDHDGLIDACDPCPYRRPGDVDGDGLFDINDFAAFVATLLNPGGAGPDARCAADLNGDGSADGLDIQAIMDALFFPEVMKRGDLNRAGFINMADISLFVAVLLGSDSDPYRVAAADVNSSNAADGADIQPFVNALLGQ